MSTETKYRLSWAALAVAAYTAAGVFAALGIAATALPLVAACISVVYSTLAFISAVVIGTILALESMDLG